MKMWGQLISLSYLYGVYAGRGLTHLVPIPGLPCSSWFYYEKISNILQSQMFYV